MREDDDDDEVTDERGAVGLLGDADVRDVEDVGFGVRGTMGGGGGVIAGPPGAVWVVVGATVVGEGAAWQGVVGGVMMTVEGCMFSGGDSKTSRPSMTISVWRRSSSSPKSRYGGAAGSLLMVLRCDGCGRGVW